MNLLLRNIRLIDLDGGVSDHRLSDIGIENGRFAEIVPANRLPDGVARTIDCGERYALPGLIDCHCHMTGIYLAEIPSAAKLIGHARWIPKQLGLNFRTQLKSGVTTVRDMTAPLRLILHLRSRSEKPENRYPRLLCSGPMLTVPGGYPPHLPPDTRASRALLGPLRVELKGEQDAIRWVDRLRKAGVDCVKIGYSTRGYDDIGSPLETLSKGLFKAVVERSHEYGLPVAVHHTWLKDLEQLADLPFDTLEHLTLDADIPENVASKIAERELPVTTNLESYAFLEKADKHLERVSRGDAPLLPTPRKSQEKMLQEIVEGRSPNPIFSLDALKGAAEQMSRNLKQLSDHGVVIGTATDAGIGLMFGSLPDEIRHMVSAGLTPAAALRAATSDAALLLGQNDLGKISSGYRADLVLYDRNPIADIDNLNEPALVLRDGLPLAGPLA